MGFFSQVKDSFTNFEAYRGFATQTGGKTFKYFFLLFTLVFLVGGIRFAYDFNADRDRIVTAVREKLPEFRLENGQLTVQGEQPMVLEGGNNTALVIDTTGRTDESVLNNYTEGVFISRDRLMTKQNFESRIISFADFKQFTLDKPKLISLLPMLKWLLVAAAVFGYIFKMAWVLITTVILSLLGLLMNSARKGRLAFGNIWNVSVYAFTLPWLLELVKNLVYPGLPIFWPVKWGLAMFFLYKGIEAANKTADPEEPRPPGDLVI